MIRLGCAFLPLCLYLLSRAHSVEERAGATTESIGTVAAARPLLLPVMFVRSFSSMVIGAEAAEHWGIGRGVSIFLGLLVLGCYAYAFFLNFRRRIYEKTTFPLLLLTSGFLNHMLVTASRWIFLNDAYGMSSRYALQYQVGIIGIMLTFLLTAEGRRRRRAAAIIVLVFSLGSFITTAREIHMAPYRQEHFIAMQQAALEYKTQTDKELTRALQYHDADRIRKALGILERQGLNIYRNQN